MLRKRSSMKPRGKGWDNPRGLKEKGKNKENEFKEKSSRKRGPRKIDRKSSARGEKSKEVAG